MPLTDVLMTFSQWIPCAESCINNTTFDQFPLTKNKHLNVLQLNVDETSGLMYCNRRLIQGLSWKDITRFAVRSTTLSGKARYELCMTQDKQTSQITFCDPPLNIEERPYMYGSWVRSKMIVFDGHEINNIRMWFTMS